MKPTCTFTGQNGNVFNLIAIATRALKNAGEDVAAREMQDRVIKASSYDEALVIMMDYVDVQ
jgi:hypothetical protein